MTLVVTLNGVFLVENTIKQEHKHSYYNDKKTSVSNIKISEFSCLTPPKLCYNLRVKHKTYLEQEFKHAKYHVAFEQNCFYVVQIFQEVTKAPINQSGKQINLKTYNCYS